VDILRAGERDGAGGIIRLTTKSGAVIHAVGVPQDWQSGTGPTWIYIVDDTDGLTLIDAGSVLAVDALNDAFKLLGMQMSSVRRIVVTHSHLDHDGGAVSLAEASGGEVWAHALYGHLRHHSFRDLTGDMNPIMWEALKQSFESRGDHMGRREGRMSERHSKYDDLRKRVPLARALHDGDQAGVLTFYHTPGHSPDELTIAMDGVLFTGDHVLPEITPHPTMKARPAAAVKDGLPDRYRDENQLYGLAAYMRSLKRVAAYGAKTTVLPAHRLLNKGRLNVMTARRANSILLHHVQRINRILGFMGKEPTSLEAVTKQLFSYRDMDGGNYHSALSETMAHLEFLVDTGDLVEVSENRLLWNGTENYREAVKSL
jgi:glyoxylase-like metal-dependent hydrolase (beta-lactamase superfamily II)